MTPQRRTRLEVLRCPQQDPSRCTEPVGGLGMQWLAEEVHKLALQYCRPEGPAIANHLTHHDALNQGPPTRDASDAGSQSPRTSRGYLRKKPGPGVGGPREGKRKRSPKFTSQKKNSARSTTARSCEGDGDVVGVVTPLVRGGAQVLHGDQVVELSVLLEVHERGEKG